MIDSHCHLNDESLIGEVDATVNRFLDAGVDRVVDIGTDIPSSILARENARKFDSVYYTIAMYPEYHQNYNEREFEDFLISCLGKNSKVAENANFDKISSLKNQYNLNNEEVVKNNNKNTENNINLFDLEKNKENIENNINNQNKYKNNVVLDNCMGSGTTGVATLNLNRRFIGIELDESYFNITKNRIEESLK